jgi:hypothetical protein
MLLEYEEYGTAGEMWVVGVFIFTTLCGGENPWRRSAPLETLVQIAPIGGRRVIFELAERYQAELPQKIRQEIVGVRRRAFRE